MTQNRRKAKPRGHARRKGDKVVPIPSGGIVINDMPWFDPVRGIMMPRDAGDHGLATKGGVRSGCYWRRPKHAPEEMD